MRTNVSLYRPFCFTDSWTCEKQQTLWGFSMGKCSWILVIAQVSFHQHHTEFHCKAKVNDFLLEMQIKKLAPKKKAFVSFIRQSFLSKSFLTSFSSSVILFSHFFSCSKSLVFVHDSGQISLALWSFPLTKPCLIPWSHQTILSTSLIFGA